MEETQSKCTCPVCKGGCQRCMLGGCGMCPYCKSGRSPLCPQCAQVLESYTFSNMTEMKDSVTSRLSFDRIVMILVLLLVLYVAYKHFQE